MNKILLLLMIGLLSVNIASALTISGAINYTPSSASTTYTHYGVSTGIESISVNATKLYFNTYGKESIILEAYNHNPNNIYWNYNVSTKKIYLNITATKTLSVSGTQALATTSTSKYEVTKNGYLLYDNQANNQITLSGPGQFIIQSDTVLDSLGNYTYSHDVGTGKYETMRSNWSITIPTSIAQQFYQVLLRDSYDNEYESTSSNNGDGTTTYTNLFNILTNIIADENVTYYWLFRKYAGGSIESERFNESITMIDMNNGYTHPTCDLPGYTPIFYGQIYDEDSVSVLLNISDVEFEFDYWYEAYLAGGQTYNTESYILDFSSPSWLYYMLCSRGSGITAYNADVKWDIDGANFINPLGIPVTTTTTTCNDNGTECNTTSETIYEYGTDRLSQRWYGIAEVANSYIGSGYIMYGISDMTNYTRMVLNLINKNNGQKLQNLLVELQRYYPGTNTWRTVQMSKTNFEGQSLFFVHQLTTNYRFVFKTESGVVIETTDSMAFVTQSDYIMHTYYIDPTIVDDISGINVASAIEYNSLTAKIYAQWAVISGQSINMNFKVIKDTSTGVLNICNENSSGTSDIYTCDVGSHMGVITVYLTKTYNGESTLENKKTYDLRASRLNGILSIEDAALWTFIILVVVVFAAIAISPVAALIAMVAGLIFVGFLGLLSGLTGSFIVVGTVIAIIIAAKVKT